MNIISNGMKHKIYFVIVAIIVGSTIFLRYKQSKHSEGTVVMPRQTIKVEIASTDSARERGLSGRENLIPGRGMLFVFPKRGSHAFWMKGMKFPIDIIWIDGNKIVDIARALLPLDGEEPRIYRPRGEANFVLEARAGSAEMLGWKIGDEVTINY